MHCRISICMLAAILALSLSNGPVRAQPVDPEAAGPPSSWRPAADAFVLIECEVAGAPVYFESGFVVAADAQRAYISAQLSRKSDPATSQSEKYYVATRGPEGSPLKIPLEKLVDYEASRDAIFSARKVDLAAPIPQVSFPDIQEQGRGMSPLRFVGIDIDDNVRTKFSYRQGPVIASKINIDRFGRAESFQVAGAPPGGPGILVGPGGGIVAYCIGTKADLKAYPTTKLKERLHTQLNALRIRVSQAGGETVLDFAMQTFDPFSSDLPPQIFVAHPSPSEKDRPEGELMHGRFTIINRQWVRPEEGSVVELKRTASVGQDFKIPKAPSDWCRASVWTGSYRFRTAEKPQPVWYQCAITNEAGKIQGLLGEVGRIPLHANSSKPVLYVHPISQPEQAKPISPSQ